MSTTEDRCEKCGLDISTEAPTDFCLKCGLDLSSLGDLILELPKWDLPSLDEVQNLLPDLEVIRLIGRGGMGAVYEATQPRLQRRVAIKVLPYELSSCPQFKSQFEHEAIALAALGHENVVQIFELGQSNNGQFYILMELIDGSDLSNAALSRVEVLDVAIQACKGLEFVHSSGYVHRDIKPTNLFVSNSGGKTTCKIGDFGLVKRPKHMASSLSFSTQIGMGTPAFCSPEQSAGNSVDLRSDVYSLGLSINHLFEQSGFTIDRKLQSIIDRATRLDPDQRFQSMREFRERLEWLLDREPTRKSRMLVPAMLTALVAISTASLFMTGMPNVEAIAPPKRSEKLLKQIDLSRLPSKENFLSLKAEPSDVAENVVFVSRFAETDQGVICSVEERQGNWLKLGFRKFTGSEHAWMAYQTNPRTEGPNVTYTDERKIENGILWKRGQVSYQHDSVSWREGPNTSQDRIASFGKGTKLWAKAGVEEDQDDHFWNVVQIDSGWIFFEDLQLLEQLL